MCKVDFRKSLLGNNVVQYHLFLFEPSTEWRSNPPNILVSTPQGKFHHTAVKALQFGRHYQSFYRNDVRQSVWCKWWCQGRALQKPIRRHNDPYLRGNEERGREASASKLWRAWKEFSHDVIGLLILEVRQRARVGGSTHLWADLARGMNQVWTRAASE